MASKTPLWLRRLEKAPRRALRVWSGPPHLDIDRRQPLLLAVRGELDAAGFSLRRARSVFRRRVLATDEEAVALAVADEATAESTGRWWSVNLVWTSADAETIVVFVVDPDGFDLNFYGWGPDAVGVLRPVGDLLARHSNLPEEQQ